MVAAGTQETAWPHSAAVWRVHEKIRLVEGGLALVEDDFVSFMYLVHALLATWLHDWGQQLHRELSS